MKQKKKIRIPTRIKACRCGHGSAIHHRTREDCRYVCFYPKCNCKNYSRKIDITYR